MRTHEQVLARIERQILDGSLRAGEKLPSERELVAALGVSRTSVREALRALEAMGVIEARVGSGPDAGSVVCGGSTTALTTVLRLQLALAQISMADLVQTRAQLERGACRQAASIRTPEDLARLMDLVEAMDSRTLRYQRFNALDSEFHVGIARASGNALTANLMEALRGAVESKMAAAFARLTDWRTVADVLNAEHASIVGAIEKGDGDAAADLVTDHITRFYRELLDSSS